MCGRCGCPRGAFLDWNQTRIGPVDPGDYLTVYSLRPVRRALGLATVVCVFFLVRLWWRGELYGPRLHGFLIWFVAALAIQLTSRSVWVWVAGFVAQVALAIVLVLTHQWTDSP